MSTFYVLCQDPSASLSVGEGPDWANQWSTVGANLATVGTHQVVFTATQASNTALWTYNHPESPNTEAETDLKRLLREGVCREATPEERGFILGERN